MRRSVPSWPKGGQWAPGPGPPRTVRLGSTALPSARPGPRLRLRSPRRAAPALAKSGWGHPPACAVSPAGPLTGCESIDSPCFGPSRTTGPVQPGAGTSFGRPGYTAADPQAWAVDSSGRSYTGGPCAAAHRHATGPYGPGTRPQKGGASAETLPG